ncbi:PQQ-dependent sugar dehydrogenase [Haloferula sp.]|uniref:PQQ-dependent sugar dehydrogenase n=1 Tax=Haloferula sp. TaxID=2497595 RepID=UPI00329BFB3C
MKHSTPLPSLLSCRSFFAALIGALAVISPASAAPPANFAVEDIVTGIDQPMSIRFFPDGRMLLAQKKGQLSIAEVLGSNRNVADYGNLTSHVFGLNFSNERGVLDLAIDPDFATAPYIYILYTPSSTPGGAKLRVSRFLHVENSGGITSQIDLSSEQLLWEDTDGYDSCCHFGGGLDFGPEGRLWITTGDHFQGSYASSLSKAGGKVHRINKDGSIPAGNPYDDGAGPNVDSTFAFGLRNPFRARWDLVNNTFYISEVGGNTQTTAWEDLHVLRYDATSGRFIDDDFGTGSDDGVYDGVNFGWPTVEGQAPYTDWPAANIDDVGEPVFAYRHGGQTAAINGGIVYQGSQFPAEYQGTYFFADSTRDFIRTLQFNPDGTVAPNPTPDPISGQNPDSSSYPFDLSPTGRIVSLEEGPDGALYYVSFTDSGGAYGEPNPSITGAVRRYVYDGGNVRPDIITFNGIPETGAPPLMVDYTFEASDVNGDGMTYTLDFGDGSTPASGSLADSSPLLISHSYTSDGSYEAILEVSDGTLSSVETIQIQVGTPPTITSLTATNDNTVPPATFFRFGDTYTFAAAAEDSSGSPIPASNFTWSVSFIRPGNTHPAVGPIDGVSSIDFPVPSQGQGFSGPVYYRAFVTVTDNNGLTTTSSTDIFPEKANISFDTVPSGIVVQVDGNTSIATPFVLDTLINYEHVITVPNTDCLGNSEYQFGSWADGPLTEQRSYTVPPTDSSLTANFNYVGECGPPADLVVDGLVLHLESDLNVGPGAGSDVAAWLDQSGLGNDLDALGNPQIISAGTPSGLPAISFDGVDDALVRNDASDPLGGLPAGNADRTMFVVANVPGPASAWAGAAYGNNQSSQAFGLVVKSNTGELVLQGYGPTDIVTNEPGIGAGWMVQSATVGGGLGTIYKDGIQIDQQTRTYNTQLNKLVLGEEIGGLGNANMQIASVLIYERKLAESERQSVENYLQQKYLAAAPVNTAPQVAVTSPANGASFNPGDNITFIATASDTEDGDLASTVTWSSSLDGPLGSGASISTNGLSEGIHGITASVTDSGSITRNDTISITVGTPSTTLPVADGLVMHLESTDGVDESGGLINQWSDISGLGNTLFASGDPQLSTTPNGLPALSLDGTDDKLERLEATDSMSGLPTGNDDRTMFVVVNYPGGSSAYAGAAYGSAAASQTFGLGIKHPDGRLIIQGYGSADLVSDELAFGAGWMIQSATVGGGQATLFRDGNQVAQAPRTFNTQLTKMVIGEEIGGLGTVTMDIAAVVIYDRELSTGERQSVEDYLQQKYLDGPPANTEPTLAITAPADDSTFTSGENITFTATANDTEDGDLSATVVWSSSLDGAIGTGASISTTGLTDGIHTITALVTDSGSLEGSDSMTLTVGSPSTTLPVANGLVLQLETTDGLTQSTGTISEWADLSGQGNTLFGSGDPQLSTTPNGQPAISLDGADDKLERLNASDPLSGLPTGNDDRTMFVVVNYPGGSTAYAGTAYGNAQSAQTFGLGIKDPEGQLVIQGYGSTDLVSNDVAFGSLWMVQSATVGGGQGTLFRDGLQIAQAPRTYDTQLNKMVIGEEIGGLGAVEMNIAAVVIYNRELSTAERQSVESYLQQKYLEGGSSNLPPSVSVTAPANTSTFPAGNTINFTGSASDLEDGDISSSIAWSSDLDGAIGTGASVLSSTLSPGTHQITASVTDSGTLSESDSISLTILPANTAPTLAITAPNGGDTFDVDEEVTFTATASDNEDGDLASSIEWTSNLDGSFGSGASVASTTLSEGTHVITAEVTDSGSLDASEAISVTIGSSSSDLIVEITAPGDGSDFASGQEITFTATATDPDGTSAEDLSLGNDFNIPGYQQVDGASENFVINLSESFTNETSGPVDVSIERFRFHAARVTDPLTPFIVRINGEEDFTVLAVGDSQTGYVVGENDLAFAATPTVISVEPGETIAPGFVDNPGDGTPGSENGAVTFVDGGDQIFYRYFDQAAGVTLNVGEALEASLPYTIPAANSFRDYFFSIEASVGGNGGGNGGSDLSDEIIWSSNLDGPLGTGGILSISNLSTNDHLITASVADSDSQTASDSILISIVAGNTPPDLVITAPSDGSSFETEEAITFTATAIDGEDGDLGASVAWTSDLDGSIGSGATLSVSDLSEGSHVITASVVDSGALADAENITVTVAAPNVGPIVEITSPADGSEFDGGQSVTFTATAFDPNGSSSEALSLGNSFDIPGYQQVDGAFENFVINLTDTFTNESSSAVDITVDRFRFHAARITDPLTPFIVRINGDDDFTVLAVGNPQTNYAVGENDLAFAASQTVISVAPGETIAPGFVDNPGDGTPGSENGAVTFVDGGDQIFYRYFDEAAGVTLEVGQAPGATLPYTVRPADSFRDYFFSIGMSLGGNNGGDLSDAIEWSSDLDGPLGTGASISLSNLSTGIHIITATATDDGDPPKSGSDSIEVAITGNWPEGYVAWLESNGIAGQTEGDHDNGGISNLEEFLLGLDPTNAADDGSFRIEIAREGDLALVQYPALKPTGSYHLHHSSTTEDLRNPENRIDTITAEMVEAMDEAERNNTVLEVTCDGTCGFFMLFFEPDAP